MTALPAGTRELWFDRVPALLWAVDAEDRTVDVNRAALDALGYTLEQVLGRSPEEFLEPESRATYRAQAILRRAGVTDGFTVTFRAADGNRHTFRVRGAPVFDGERFVAKIAVLRPIADLPPGAAELSHDLRNPLQAILGFAELLDRGIPGPLNPEQHVQVGMIEAAARDALARLDAFDRERTGRP